jgi:hypothetical protein
VGDGQAGLVWWTYSSRQGRKGIGKTAPDPDFAALSPHDGFRTIVHETESNHLRQLSVRQLDEVAFRRAPSRKWNRQKFMR